MRTWAAINIACLCTDQCQWMFKAVIQLGPGEATAIRGMGPQGLLICDFH